MSSYWEPHKFALFENHEVKLEFEQRYSEALDRASRHRDRLESALDFGCGTGNHLEFLQSRELTAFGVDINEGALARARARGLNVAHASNLSTLIPEESVDLVTIWDVIEHLYDPLSGLRAAVSRLRVGGILILETPNADFMPRRLLLGLGKHTGGRVSWFETMYYWEHKVYFSALGLKTILSEVQCEILALERRTSPRAKMSHYFSHDAAVQGTGWSHVVKRTWPVAERLTRRAGSGNALFVIAKRER